jgi:hypothetical protein
MEPLAWLVHFVIFVLIAAIVAGALVYLVRSAPMIPEPWKSFIAHGSSSPSSCWRSCRGSWPTRRCRPGRSGSRRTSA